MVLFCAFHAPAQPGCADSFIVDDVLDRVAEIIAPVVFAELERGGAG